MTDSDFLLDHAGDWDATRRCATRWRGRMTFSRTRKDRCWSGVRFSLVDSTSKAPALYADLAIWTTTKFLIFSTRWYANRWSSPTDRRDRLGFPCWRPSANSPTSISSREATLS